MSKITNPDAMTWADACEEIHEIHPETERHWGATGIDIPCLDHHIIVTEDDDGYLIGIYFDDGWLNGSDPDHTVTVDSPEDVVALVDAVTDLEPADTWPTSVAAWITAYTSTDEAS
jgi:hypothetical protein